MDDAIAVPAQRSESISGYMRVAGYLAERDTIRRLDRLGVVGIRKKMPAIRKTPAIRWRRRPAPNEIDYLLCHVLGSFFPHQCTEYRRAARPAAWVAQPNPRENP